MISASYESIPNSIPTIRIIGGPAKIIQVRLFDGLTPIDKIDYNALNIIGNPITPTLHLGHLKSILSINSQTLAELTDKELSDLKIAFKLPLDELELLQEYERFLEKTNPDYRALR
jgi:hypothetical protein